MATEIFSVKFLKALKACDFDVASMQDVVFDGVNGLDDLREMNLREPRSGVTTTKEEVNLQMKEFFAGSWRDDDSPQAEKTYGVKLSDELLVN